MADSDIAGLLVDRRLNAALAWLVAGALALIAAGNVLAGEFLWAGFAGAVLALVLVPPVSDRAPATMLPWEVLVLAALPILGRGLATIPETGRVATYLSVGALALIVAVELHAFTSVKMTAGFAVLFVVVATLATAGVWAVVRWSLDRWLDTAFLLDPAVAPAAIERGLMIEFVASAVAGLLAGVVFEYYVRRRARLRERVGAGARP